MNRWLPACLLLGLLVAFRVLGSSFPEAFPNLQPLLALLLCSMVFLQGRQRWGIPLAVWIVTDPWTSWLQGHPLVGWHHLALVLGLGVTVGLAHWARRKPDISRLTASAILSSVSFYLVTNAVAFAADPLYPKTWQGLLQAQWTGPEGFGPTWLFLRNLLAANLLFTGLFLAARYRLPAPEATATPKPA